MLVPLLANLQGCKVIIKISSHLIFDIFITHFDIESTLCNLYSSYVAKHGGNDDPIPYTPYLSTMTVENLLSSHFSSDTSRL